MSTRNLVLLGLMASVICFPMSAPAQSLLLQNAVNLPAADQWTVMGQDQTHAVVKDPTVNGGWATTISVTASGSHEWDVQAGTVTSKKIEKGDVILLAFWAKRIGLSDSQTAIVVPTLLQVSHAPYTPIGSEALVIGSQWQLYYVSGVSSLDLSPGEAGASLHLASAKQKLALGPVFILDLGPGYDMTKLPRNLIK